MQVQGTGRGRGVGVRVADEGQSGFPVHVQERGEGGGAGARAGGGVCIQGLWCMCVFKFSGVPCMRTCGGAGELYFLWCMAQVCRSVGPGEGAGRCIGRAHIHGQGAHGHQALQLGAIKEEGPGAVLVLGSRLGLGRGPGPGAHHLMGLGFSMSLVLWAYSWATKPATCEWL